MNITTTAEPDTLEYVVHSVITTLSACQFIIYSSAIEIAYLVLATLYHLFLLNKSRQDPKVA